VSSQGNGFWGWINQLYVSIEDFVLAAVYVTFTFVVRLTILVLAPTVSNDHVYWFCRWVDATRPAQVWGRSRKQLSTIVLNEP
jgi:hypothetical protein